MESDARKIMELQANEHPLVFSDHFQSLEEYCLFLMHQRAYEEGARLSKERAVLDLGCNNGYGTNLIGGIATSVVGCDVSADALADARRRFPALDFRQIDGFRLPFGNAAFDVVLSFQVIEHIADTGSYLAEIIRVLKPHGTAVFTTPNAAIRLDPGMRPWNRFHVREYRANELQHVLAEAFSAVQLRGLFAVDELYDVEYRRCRAARERSRHPPRPSPGRNVLGRAFVRSMKALLPSAVVDTLRRGVSDAGHGTGTATLNVEAMNRFSTADLFYSEHDLDGALDLMAMCTKT